MIIEKKDRSNKYNPVHKKLHELWRSMINRCCSPRSHSYDNYGALGVTICDKWMSYDGFLDDVDSIDGYNIDKLIKGNLQLDKDVKQSDIDISDRIYSLETCVFVTKSENSGNRWNNKLFIAMNYFDDKYVITKNREKFCRENNIDTSSFFRVLQSTNDINWTHGNDKKRSNFCKGWTGMYVDGFNIDNLPKMKIAIFTNHITGERFKVMNVSDFCIENNLSINGANSTIKGRQKKFSEHWGAERVLLDYKSATTIESKLKELNLI